MVGAASAAATAAASASARAGGGPVDASCTSNSASSWARFSRSSIRLSFSRAARDAVAAASIFVSAFRSAARA